MFRKNLLVKLDKKFISTLMATLNLWTFSLLSLKAVTIDSRCIYLPHLSEPKIFGLNNFSQKHLTDHANALSFFSVQIFQKMHCSMNFSKCQVIIKVKLLIGRDAALEMVLIYKVVEKIVEKILTFS